MKVWSFATLALGSILVAGVLASAAQEKKGAEKAEKHESAKSEAMVIDSATAKYVEAIPGVSRAVLSGDPDKGAYRVFTKFAPGVKHPMHTHPNDIWLVVIKGAYIQTDEKGQETRVGPGCAFHVAAGMKHASRGDDKEGVVMLEESNEKFGMEPVERKEEKKDEKKEKK